MNYLKCGYGGSEINMNELSCFYCYTIYDTVNDMYYSGSRGVNDSNRHDLLVGYFTGSSVKDFQERLKTETKSFIYVVEYFETRKLAFDAERLFHDKHEVGKNKKFYNVMNAALTNCGAGSTICRAADGSTYRVSSIEFRNNPHKHKHATHGRMPVRMKSSGEEIINILIEDFDESIHETQFKNHVLCFDKVENRNRRIKNDLFLSDPDRYVGITRGLVAAIDKDTKERVLVEKSVFDCNKEKYSGLTLGYSSVILKSTGDVITIDKKDYDRNIHSHHNSDMQTVYSFNDRRNIRISVDEYRRNPELYANCATKSFFKVDGKFLKSLDSLRAYYRRTRGVHIRNMKPERIHKFPDVEIIQKSEHMKG